MYFGPLVTLMLFCFCIVDQSYQFIYPMFLLPSETDAALSTATAVPPSPPPDAAEEAAAGRGPAARAGAARQVRRRAGRVRRAGPAARGSEGRRAAAGRGAVRARRDAEGRARRRATVAATVNASAGHVGKAQITGPVADAGATVIEAELAGRRVVTESIGGQVVAKMMTPAPVAMTDPPGALDKDDVTVGRALEAVVAMAEDRPVDQSDAAAIQVAETCATGSHATIPGAVTINCFT